MAGAIGLAQAWSWPRPWPWADIFTPLGLWVTVHDWRLLQWLTEETRHASKTFRGAARGPVSKQRLSLPIIGIPIIKIRGSSNCFIFALGITKLVRWHLYIEKGPSAPQTIKPLKASGVINATTWPFQYISPVDAEETQLQHIRNWVTCLYNTNPSNLRVGFVAIVSPQSFAHNCESPPR